MERTKYLFIIAFILFSLAATGQNNKTIYNAYIRGDMDTWKYAIDSIETKEPKTNREILDLINYQYGYIAWCISKEKSREARKYINKAEKLIETLDKQNYNSSYIYAYRAAFVGFEIGLATYKAPFIGPQSLLYANQSVATDTLNPLAYAQLGNIAFYTPKLFGGSKAEAMQHYAKALKLMQTNTQNLKNSWNYLNLLATIINAHMELEQYKMAKKYCLITLTFEPEFEWVKNKLYPEILKKLSI